ncbi:MAG: TetR/AcrR family transcriptional regulator [Pseudomonadota bacterium]
MVEATRQLVEEKGPDRFSVSDACRVAGVSTAAPYRHFADREEMLLEVVLAGMDRFYEALESAHQPHPRGSLAAITALGHAYVDFAAREPGVFRLMFGLTQRQGQNEVVRDRGMRVYGVLLHQIAAHFGHASIDDHVQERAFPLWTFVHGLSFLLIDEKTDQLNLEVARTQVVADATRRLLGTALAP